MASDLPDSKFSKRRNSDQLSLTMQNNLIGVSLKGLESARNMLFASSSKLRGEPQEDGMTDICKMSHHIRIQSSNASTRSPPKVNKLDDSEEVKEPTATTSPKRRKRKRLEGLKKFVKPESPGPKSAMNQSM